MKKFTMVLAILLGFWVANGQGLAEESENAIQDSYSVDDEVIQQAFTGQARRPISYVTPIYPGKAQRKNKGGYVLIQYTINKDGLT